MLFPPCFKRLIDANLQWRFHAGRKRLKMVVNCCRHLNILTYQNEGDVKAVPPIPSKFSGVVLVLALHELHKLIREDYPGSVFDVFDFEIA
jgi:hypothetical protein